MRIAILLSTYNGEKYLVPQISSLLSQKFSGTVIICVRDDGSSDKTVDILRGYEKEEKISLSIGENLGSAKSFLQLLKDNPGYDYYAFCDQDDIWFNTKIQRAVDKIKNYNIPALYSSNARLVNGDLSDAGRNVHNHCPVTNIYGLSCEGGHIGCTMVFNKELARAALESGLPDNILCHDAFMSLLCVALNGALVYDEEPSLLYRRHENNATDVPRGLKGTIKNRFAIIKGSIYTDIAGQANAVLEICGESIDDEKRSWLEQVSRYKKSFMTRIKLSLSRKTKYQSLNSSITNRIAIAFGNK